MTSAAEGANLDATGMLRRAKSSFDISNPLRTSQEDLATLMSQTANAMLAAHSEMDGKRNKIEELKGKREKVKKELKEIAKQKKKEDRKQMRKRKKLQGCGTEDLYTEALIRHQEIMKRRIKKEQAESKAAKEAAPSLARDQGTAEEAPVEEREAPTEIESEGGEKPDNLS